MSEESQIEKLINYQKTANRILLNELQNVSKILSEISGTMKVINSDIKNIRSVFNLKVISGDVPEPLPKHMQDKLEDIYKMINELSEEFINFKTSIDIQTVVDGTELDLSSTPSA